MDGLPSLPSDRSGPLALLAPPIARQHTLNSAIACSGIGLHTGNSISVSLVPAPPGHGIAFQRPGCAPVSARHDRVSDTRLCTVLGDGPTRVGTIEHLMAALSAAGIDNLLVEVSGPELPVFDGSSEPWLFLLDCAGRAEQDAPRIVIEVLRPIQVQDGEAFASLRPGQDSLDLALSIEFGAAAIGRQALTLSLDSASFRRELATARTFVQRHEIEGLQSAGLALGGSLDNAIVVDGDQVLNPSGLRQPDEFVRHKMLDAVGDLALAGAALHARFIGHRSGHALNNRLLYALFKDPANWRYANTPALASVF